LDFVFALLLNQPTHYLPKKILCTTSTGKAQAGSMASKPGYSRSESPATTTEEEKFTS
jgi:hypothetical protein